MTVGGPTNGDSNRARKAAVRAAKQWLEDEVQEVQVQDMPDILFRAKDAEPILRPHHDALVITAKIGKYDVRRIFVDTGCSVNIMFWECFRQMGLNVILEEIETSLYGFGCGVVHPKGEATFQMIMGDEPFQSTKMIKFLIVDLPSHYNVLMGRPALNEFQAVVSTFHMKLKFPADSEGTVGEVLGDQVSSRRCYAETVKEVSGTQKRELNRVQPDLAAKRLKEAKLLEEEPDMQIRLAEEELMMVELFPNKTGFSTRIGTQMTHEVATALIACLRKNADLFAFQASDMVGIDPSVAVHCLNVDPRAKPVVTRKF